MLADILGRPLQLHRGGDVGPALGAARLARMAVDGDEDPSAACPPPPLLQVLEPHMERHREYLARRQPLFRELYARLGGLRRDDSAADGSGHAA
jgi:xylulokinase